MSVLLFETLALTPPDCAIIPDSNIKNYNGKGKNDKIKRRQRFRVDAGLLVVLLMQPSRGVNFRAQKFKNTLPPQRSFSLIASCPIHEEEGDNDDANPNEMMQNRIYAFSNQTDTETGRTTSVNPNCIPFRMVSFVMRECPHHCARFLKLRLEGF